MYRIISFMEKFLIFKTQSGICNYLLLLMLAFLVLKTELLFSFKANVGGTEFFKVEQCHEGRNLNDAVTWMC